MQTTQYQTPSLGLLRIDGADAKKLLQGQITCDIEQITNESLQLAAHCNPKGRIISLFHIFYKNDSYYLLMQQEMLSLTINAFKKYAVFYKITMTSEDSTFDSANLHKKWVENGIATLYPRTSGQFLPHELNLHLLGALDFNKGCYTGQEIIARMHYRGKSKNQLLKATLSASSAPTPGAIILNGTTSDPCGVLVDYHQETDKTYRLLILCEESTHPSHLLIQSASQTDIITILDR